MEPCAPCPEPPADPEGTTAPLASPAPYYVAEYVPGERVVLERNRFYHGNRPHHVDRLLHQPAGAITEIDLESVDLIVQADYRVVEFLRRL
jgi:ABC-type oligopeptide transport system substrate-binding subunit